MVPKPSKVVIIFICINLCFAYFGRPYPADANLFAILKRWIYLKQ